MNSKVCVFVVDIVGGGKYLRVSIYIFYVHTMYILLFLFIVIITLRFYFYSFECTGVYVASFFYMCLYVCILL
jgi:hypothetical protein